MAWIAWDKVLASKENGGLDIGSPKAQNLALLGKWWWRFKTVSNDLWAAVIRSLHGPTGSLDIPSRTCKNGGCWSAIAKLPRVTSKCGLQFKELFQATKSSIEVTRWTWALNSSKLYFVSSYREYCDKILLPSNERVWLWNELVPRKVNILAWRVMHNRLPTLSNLEKIGIGSSTLCKICGAGVENEDHIFAGCHVTKMVWTELKDWWCFLDPSLSSSMELLKSKSSFTGHPSLVNVHEAVHLVFIWVIWTYRNDRAFRSITKSHEELATEVILLSHLWLNARKRNGLPLRWGSWKVSPDIEWRNCRN